MHRTHLMCGNPSNGPGSMAIKPP